MGPASAIAGEGVEPVRRLLLACGTLSLATMVLPWHPRPLFAWDVMARATDWFDRLWPPFLLVSGLLAIAGLFLKGRARAALAVAIGAGGYLLWFLVEPPNMVLMWEGRWQMPVFLIGVVAIPVGVLGHRQIVATLGAVAVAIVLLTPVATRAGDQPVLAIFLRKLAHPEKLMWQETSTVLWWFILTLAAAGTLVLWAARSHALERALAVIVILWPAMLALLTGVLHTVAVSGEPAVFWRLPVGTLAPFLLGLQGWLLVLGLHEFVGRRAAAGAAA